MANYRNEMFAKLVDAARALSDPGRIRILMALDGHELCVCQIVELLGLAPSTVSNHMNVLRRAGFVRSRKKGRWVYCRLAGTDGTGAAAGGMEWVRHLSKSPEIRDDRKRLSTILKTDPEKLCRRMEES
jgi:DNA-binding transcriptional ArsR family regulator